MPPAAIATPPATWSPPATSYLVCTTPRSGSTFLCRLLRGARDMGRPDEHLAEGRNTAARAAGGPAWIEAIVREGRSANGVFGVKLFPPHHRALQQAGIRPGDWLPGLRHVLLRRRDLVGQAVSFAIALQTDQWVGWKAPETPREARYDAPLIARLFDRLVEWEGYWRRYFALAAVTPLELDYEEVQQRPAAAVAAIRAHLGLPAVPHAGPAEPFLPTRPQRTSRNDEWRARFLADLERQGYDLLDRPRRARAGVGTLADWVGGRLRRPAFRLRRGG
jgi:LPS sulfotransferase NodH